MRDVDTWHFSVNNERELKNTEAQRMLIFRNDGFNFQVKLQLPFCFWVFSMREYVSQHEEALEILTSPMVYNAMQRHGINACVFI